MGTKVQSKGYLLGYGSMRDLNEDSNSCSWPTSHEDKTLPNGHYNEFLPRTLSDADDKGVLKQKMLEHEAMFKNQVYDLHCVYRTQRGLMEEIKRKELNDTRIPAESPFLSSPQGYQTTPEYVQKLQSNIFPLSNTVDGRSSFSGASATASPLSCIREKEGQISPFALQNEGSSRNADALESRPSKVRRKLLDLELPASDYIDIEDGEHAKEENVSQIFTNVNDYNFGNRDTGVRIFLNGGGNADSQVGASALQRKNGLIDLNEPVQIEGTNSAVVGSLSRVSCHRKIHMEPESQFVGLPKRSVLSPHHYNGMPNSLQLNMGEDDKSWISRVLQAGCNNGKINREFWRDERNLGMQAHQRGHGTSNAVCLDSVTPSQLPSPFTNGLPNFPHPRLHRVTHWESKKGSQSQNMTTHMHPYLNSSSLSTSSQPSRQNHGNFSNGWHANCSNQNRGSGNLKQNGIYLGSASVKRLPHDDSSPGYGHPSCSVDINPTSEHLPKPCYAKNFNGVHVMNPKVEIDLNLNAVPSNNLSTRQYLGNTVEVIDLESKNDGILPWLRPKSACRGLHVVSPKIEEDLNLNAIPANNLSKEHFSQKTVEVIDLESKRDGILPWLRPKSGCSKQEMEVGENIISGKLSSLYSSSESLVRKESENVSSSHNASNFKPSSDFSKNETKMAEERDCLKILGVPIFKKPYSLESESKCVRPASASSLSSKCEVQENNKINVVVDINLPVDPDPDIGNPSTCETLAIDKVQDTNGLNFRHQFDLNSLANDGDISLVSNVLTTTEKVVLDIDLEALPIPESKDDDTLEGLPAKLEGAEGNATFSLDELVQVAAEAIVTISVSDLQSNLDYISALPSEASTPGALKWFAEIASSCGNTIVRNSDSGMEMASSCGNTIVRNSDSGMEIASSRDGIDDFELMTLKLIECNAEEYMPKPLVPDNIKLEETSTSFLTNRPRRGQARRGRQRKDFQRDILPGLVSLSRHEVTEDLHTFGGLMRATGHSWNSRLGRRITGRNGSARGRRRSLASSPPTAETRAASTLLIKQHNNVEVGLRLEDRNLQGWGKTTRRPRRQRFPAGNHPTPPVT